MKYIKKFEKYNNTKYLNIESIDEGTKDIVLSILFLTGILTTSKGQYAKVVKNPDSDFVKKVETFIDDSSNVNKLWDIIDKTKGGFKNKEEYEKKLQYSFDDLKKRYDKLRKKEYKFKKAEIEVKNTSDINRLLKLGFVPEQLFITKETIVQDSLVEVESTIPINYLSDVTFKTGTWELTNDFKENIKSKILTILNDENMDIIEIQISTSTDKEPIKMGNKKLSENRSNSIKKYLNSLIDIDIKTTDDNGNDLIKYDQGPDIYSPEMTKKEREEARELTKEYRDVEISIKIRQSFRDPEPVKMEEIIEKEKIVLIKISKEEKTKRKDTTETKGSKKPKRRWFINKNEVKCIY
jgi:outer membrane protein OmpA-like peptidoglycan-associated protein